MNVMAKLKRTTTIAVDFNTRPSLYRGSQPSNQRRHFQIFGTAQRPDLCDRTVGTGNEYRYK
jgi:hypothetical protein